MSAVAQTHSFWTTRKLMAAGAILAVYLVSTNTYAAENPDPEPDWSKPVSGQLNSGTKTITMTVPFTAGTVSLGDMVISIAPGDAVSVGKAPLLEKLTPELDPAALQRLEAVPEENGALALTRIKQAGFDLDFDRSQLALVYNPKGIDRATGDLSLGGGAASAPILTVEPELPAAYAGYVNLTAGLDHTWANSLIADQTATTFDAAPVLKLRDWAVLADWSYQSTAQPFICPVGAYCLGDQAGGFKRQFARAVYDWSKDYTRLELGDTEPIATDFQTATETLGFSFEHSQRKMAPGERYGPTDATSFRIDRPSDVDVIINGSVVRHMHLEPGPYNLKDIPLQAGGNEITLAVTDDTGQRRTQTFTAFSDPALLETGASEWALTGGLPSYISDAERVYRTGYVTASGFYRYGATKALTTEFQAQADTDVAEGGAKLMTAMPVGYLSGGIAASAGRLGSGFGAEWSWSLANARILMRQREHAGEALSFSINYRSPQFHTPGEYLATAGDIIYPQYDYSWRANGFYSAQLNDTLNMTLSARYAAASSVPASGFAAPYTYTGNRYGLDLTLSAPIGDKLSASFTVGYGNDNYVDPTMSDPGFHAGIRLAARVDEHTSVQASYDTLSRNSLVSGTRDWGATVDHWDANVQVNHDGVGGATDASATVGYVGNRLEARVTHSGGYEGGLDSLSGPGPALQQTSVSVGTAIAFAGGKFAIGAPVRGDAFAIVYPHQSLAGRAITVGDPEFPRGYADGFGPALIGNLPADTHTNIPVTVPDLPLGYSLGKGSFDLKPPFRGGYALQVGSSHSVSAFGTLVDADAQPLSLLTGTAHAEGDTAHPIAVFTNAAGRFGADGLSPGRWVIEMATDSGGTYVIDIPAGTDGLFRAGTLKPQGSGQ